MVVRTVPDQVFYLIMQKYPLREKDVIKFGKLRVRVREIILYDVNNSGVSDFNAIKTSKKVY